VVAPDLPCDDDSAGLKQYTDVVVNAIGYFTDVIVVAQSLGGFTAPLVCARVRTELMVLVAAMVPAPGETGDDWWANTGYPKLDKPFDVKELFFHDVPPDVTAEAFRRGEKEQSGTPMKEPWPLKKWPNVPTRFLLCRQDRFSRRIPAPSGPNASASRRMRWTRASPALSRRRAGGAARDTARLTAR
jgi:hypothetical protein